MNTSLIKNVLMISVAVLLMGSSAFGTPVTARLSAVKGKVELSKGDSWTAAKDGDSIAGGAKLRTGADGSCLVTWGGGNAMKAQSLTSITLDQLENNGKKETSQFSISQGKVLAKAKRMSGIGSSYALRTPTAVAGVRGTDFAVGVAGNVSSFQVVEGSVEVGIAGAEPVLVGPGFEVKVPVGVTSIPAPEPIPPVELKELQQNMQDVKVSVETSSETSKEGTKEETAGVSKDVPTLTAVDQTLNTVDQTLQTNAIQDAIQNQINTGTVQVDINVGPPPIYTGTVQVDINVAPR